MTGPMPWFLPLGAAMAFVGTRAAVRMHREGRGKGDSLLLLALCWFPLLIWLLLHVYPQE